MFPIPERLSTISEIRRLFHHVDATGLTLRTILFGELTSTNVIGELLIMRSARLMIGPSIHYKQFLPALTQ